MRKYSGERVGHKGFNKKKQAMHTKVGTFYKVWHYILMKYHNKHKLLHSSKRYVKHMKKEKNIIFCTKKNTLQHTKYLCNL